MTELTRSESAGLFADIVGQIETRSPESTNGVRDSDAATYLALNFNMAGMHPDHYRALNDALNGAGALEEIDRHAVKMRSFMTLAAPWYDAA